MTGEPNWANQTLWTGDNLGIMRGMNSACVDLIYLDPPFNSNANYAAPSGSLAEGAGFKDTWGLADIDRAWCESIRDKYPGLYALLHGVMLTHGKSMMAYLIYMIPRLVELKRLLKETGSLYLHCDPTAGHYLKMVLDAVFGRVNFKANVVWPRYAPHSLAKGPDTITDFLLVYSGGGKTTWHGTYTPFDKKELAARFPYLGGDGRRYRHVSLEQSSNKSSAGAVRIIQGRKVVTKLGWRWTQETFDSRLAENPDLIAWTSTGRPQYKLYADEYLGRPTGNLWSDIGYLSSSARERTGYPTQKPLKLLERIIRASSNEGDVVLDPFCGCATTCIAAELAERQWVGIDISPQAADLVKLRLRETEALGLMFKGSVRDDVPVRTDLDQLPKYNAASHKKSLYGEQGGACNGCGHHFPAHALAIDHIIPRAKGGSDDIGNLQLLCSGCNSVKGDRPHAYLLKRLAERGLLRLPADNLLDVMTGG